jgi:hypothetical protein
LFNIGFPSIQICFIDDVEVFGADETPGVGAVVDDLQRDNLVAHRRELTACSTRRAVQAVIFKVKQSIKLRRIARGIFMR